MRLTPYLIGGLGLLIAYGCSGSGQTPLAPEATPPIPEAAGPEAGPSDAGLGHVIQRGDTQQGALGIYTIELDPAELTATAALKEIRSVQANDDLYLLSVSNFLRTDSFRVLGVRQTADEVLLDYAFTHPFPTPADPAGQQNAFSNRSDLGITGFALFLLDVPHATGYTFFGDRVVNTDVITNADAYYSPAGLLNLGSMGANTFPYKVLVDELASGTGSRQGISNGGSVIGNFGPEGWTRAELTEGWSGYGFVAQGTTALNTLALDKDAISGTPFILDVVIIAKYNDPRGGVTGIEKRSNRLPPATPDAAKFAYRMPHAALDVESIAFLGDNGPGFDEGISGTELSFAVVDWDANATATVHADLANELDDLTRVALGEPGLPEVAIDIPGIISTPVIWPLNSESGAGSGMPDNPLVYTMTVTKTTTGTPGGAYTGLVRVTDPEVHQITDPNFILELEGDLTPLSANFPIPQTYQRFTVELPIIPPNAPPSAIVVYTGSTPLLSATQPTISVMGIADPNNDPISIQVDWNDGNGFVFAVIDLNAPYGTQGITGPQRNNPTLAVTPIDLTVRLTDGFNTVDYPLSYNLGPNRPPQVTGTPALAVSSLESPASFTMSLGTATATDPENDAISYTIVNNRNSDELTFAAFPNAANSTAITNPPHANVLFTVYANDPLHATTSGTAYPGITGTITMPPPPIPPGWVYTPPTSTSGQERPYSIAVDDLGNALITGVRGTSTGALNFGGGARPVVNSGTQYWVLKLDVSGNYAWDKVWGSSGIEGRAISVDADSAGNAYVYGTWNNLLDISGLGGGATNQTASGGSSPREAFVLKFDANGNYQALARTTDTVDYSSLLPQSASTSFSNHGASSSAMRIDRSSNSIFVTGTPDGSGTVNFGTGGTVTTLGAYDAILVKFNSSLAPQWAINLAAAGGGGNNQHGVSVAINPNTGDPIVGGVFLNSINLGGGSVSSMGGSVDCFLVQRSNATGAYVSGSQRTFGSSVEDNLASISADSAHIYVTGTWATGSGQSFNLGSPLAALTSSATHDGFVGAYTLGNSPVWQFRTTGSSNEIGVATASNGSEVFLFSHFNSSNSNWGYGSIGTLGSTDMLLGKYNAATGATGYYQQRWGTSGAEWAAGGVALQPNGSLFLAGQWGGTGTSMNFDPGGSPSGLKTSVGGGDLFIVRLNGNTGTF